MAEFHHGITGRETASGKIPIRNAATAVIAMLAFADDADEEAFPLNTPVLVTSINRVLPKAGTTGNLRKNLEIISQITSPTLVVIRIESPYSTDEFDQSLVIGTTEETGQRTGLQALLTVKSMLGLTPKIICVPDVETIDVTNAIGTICKKLRAYSYITPRNASGLILQSAEQVVNFRNMLAFREIELIWPEWISGNVFLGSDKNGAMSAGISPDLQYSDEESENEINWAIEVNSTLFPIEIGNGEYSYLEDYLQENKETLGITGEYKSESDEGENDSSVYIYNITNTRKFVRLIPDKPYKSEMKLIGNPTAKIDSDGIISFWLEANNEVQIPDPEPEVCNCESSWILIPELTPSVKIGAYDELVLAIGELTQNIEISYQAGTPVIDLLNKTLSYSIFKDHLELIRCDGEGTLLRNKTDDCLTISMMTVVKNSDGIKEAIRYLPETDLCAYDASEVIPDTSTPIEPENWDIKYKVNGQWIYETTGPIVELSEERNNTYRNLATELVFNDTVTEVGYMSFQHWKTLISVDLGQSVTKLGAYSFEMCKTLPKLIIPNSLQAIGNTALGGCEKISLLDIGTGLELIEEWALVNLYSLNTLIFRGPVAPTVKPYVFGSGSNATNPLNVYIPDNLFADYSASLWNLPSGNERFKLLSIYIP